MIETYTGTNGIVVLMETGTDLTNAQSASVKFTNGEVTYTIPCTVTDAEGGIVQLILSSGHLATAGEFFTQLTVFFVAGVIGKSEPFSIIVRESLV